MRLWEQFSELVSVFIEESKNFRFIFLNFYLHSALLLVGMFQLITTSYHVRVPGWDVYVHLVDLDAHDQPQVLLRVLHPLAATDNIY